MKNIILVFFLFLSTTSTAQNPYIRLIRKYVHNIDTLHKFKRCDSISDTYKLSFDIPIRSDMVMLDIVDSTTFESEIERLYYKDVSDYLVEKFYKINYNQRKNFTKLCFILEEIFEIKDYEPSGVYWVSGKLRVDLLFQNERKKNL